MTDIHYRVEIDGELPYELYEESAAWCFWLNAARTEQENQSGKLVVLYRCSGWHSNERRVHLISNQEPGEPHAHAAA